MKELIENRLLELKEKPFSELVELEPCQSEQVSNNGKRVIVSVWKDEVGEGELRIVVQAYRRWFLGIGKMDAQGFLSSRSGEIRDLSKEDLYEFI